MNGNCWWTDPPTYRPTDSSKAYLICPPFFEGGHKKNKIKFPTNQPYFLRDRNQTQIFFLSGLIIKKEGVKNHNMNENLSLT
jgi:hypothetical protein